MKIQSLHLANYRCFDDLNINLDPQLTVLVGINGSGKTAVLDALGIFLKMYAGNFWSYLDNVPVTDLRHGHDSAQLFCEMDAGVPRHPRNRFDISVTLTKNLTSHYVDIQRDDTGLYGIKNIFLDFPSPCPFPMVVYYSSKRILDKATQNEGAKPELMYAYTNAFSPQIDFSTSLAWFIEKASQEALEAKRLKDMEHTIPELSAVRMAVSKALGEYGEPFVGETPPVLFVPQKDDLSKVFRIEELSDGYRTMLALVMDLARRMAVANSHIEWSEDQTVLHSPGIVLIDEVELHLHPSWQQTVLPTLMKIFPSVQFIVTTHSPQVLTSIEPHHIRILEKGKVLPAEIGSFGAQSGRVLEDILGVNPRPQEADSTKALNSYFNLINIGEGKTEAALKLREQLENWLADDPALAEADMLIAHQARLRAKKRESSNA
ncbi:AAA family ATPase [Desulfosarcina sp. OttesenSCG-928-A07]|nr:AAA family ATPase [Desulfosarcina sp. OttesenSCG-928-A07]